ncbi:MAG: DUF3106 domain-containing protein [Ramlibacter sp.]|nr:DUF3106 domain-containing protein [Ramlibacter sp.]
MALCLNSPSAAAQAPLQPATAPIAAASKAAMGKPAASAGKAAVKRETKPTWAELVPEQRQALAPLAGTWETVSEAQKRKWIALSGNFTKLPPAEQVKMHSRMTDWVALSSAQRTQARLNFGETKQLAPEEKKAKWEAYQALSPEEKSKLRAGAAKPSGTAAAVKPVAPEKLVVVPKSTAKQETKAPRIAVAPNPGDHLTPQTAPAAPPSN